MLLISPESVLQGAQIPGLTSWDTEGFLMVHYDKAGLGQLSKHDQ